VAQNAANVEERTCGLKCDSKYFSLRLTTNVLGHCESAVLNHRAINATNTVWNDN
jgi:hypothetical protein